MKKPTPETDAVAAYEGNWDTKALRMTAHSRKLERELKELRQWKKEMLLIESQWDEQIVGRLLGLQLGDYIKPKIEPKLRQLIRERDEARAERDILRSNKMSDPLLETTFKHLNRERDEACQVANGLAKQVERLRKERDEARKEINIIRNTLSKNGEAVGNGEHDFSIIEMVENLIQSKDYFILKSDSPERERDEAREKYDQICYRTLIEINKVCDERDKLRKECDQFRSLNESYAACWEEIRAALGESEQGDKTCDLDRVLKAIRERDKARKEAEYYKERCEQLKERPKIPKWYNGREIPAEIKEETK